MCSAEQPRPRSPRRLAEIVIGAPLAACCAVRGGGNNRLYRLTLAGGGAYALKIYPADDPRDRLGREIRALDFLRGRGIDQVPAVVAVNSRRHAAVFEWIDGQPARGDVAELAAFLARLRRESARPVKMPPAVEACLSGAVLAAQLEARIARLAAALPPTSPAGRFVRQELTASLSAHVIAARRRLGAAFDDMLSPRLQVLSPSDFGFHNALRQADGRLRFIDFEYFGWDDPVKLLADTLWHPGMALNDAQRDALRRQAVRRLPAEGDTGFADRLSALYPLYGLRWVLILLNEFLPAAAARRMAAQGYGQAALAARQAGQLTKARALLAELGGAAGMMEPTA